MCEAFSVDRLTCIRPNEDENQSRMQVTDGPDLLLIVRWLNSRRKRRGTLLDWTAIFVWC